jgi:hypothetical protein
VECPQHLLSSPHITLGDELKLHIIELAKADRLGHTTGHLADWITLFEHWQEDSTMQTVDYPLVQQALDRLKGLSADAETRRQAFVRERALLDEASAINAATARGIEQGIEKGMQHEAISILERLLTKRFGPLSADTRAKLNAASLDQLDRWADRILDAPTLAAVFEDH